MGCDPRKPGIHGAQVCSTDRSPPCPTGFARGCPHASEQALHALAPRRWCWGFQRFKPIIIISTRRFSGKPIQVTESHGFLSEDNAVGKGPRNAGSAGGQAPCTARTTACAPACPQGYPHRADQTLSRRVSMSHSSTKLASVRRSSSMTLQACSTVVWSRPPKLWPMSFRLMVVCVLHSAIAT